jgi:serine/threonine protein kinase
LTTYDKGHRILDKYEIIGQLGKGGMGVVVAARHLTMGTVVAIKFLNAKFEGNAEAVARFVHEARLGARINSKHVAQVYDVDQIDGAPFIVMQYLDGESLDALLEKRRQLDVAEAADILLQACEGIDEAHAAGVIHRDLKPSNLFVTTERGKPFIRVLDFGIAKSTGPSDVSITACAAVFGSPGYMSPEQYEPTRNVDTRTDVWSLGVILYELLTGTRPFPGNTIAEVYAALHAGSYKNPAIVRAEIPPGVVQLIAQALEREPDKRLPSVEAFAAKLAPFGTDVGQACYATIQRLRAGSSEGARNADSETPPPTSLATPPANNETTPVRATSSTGPSIVVPQPKSDPPARRWPRYAAASVVVAAAAAASAIVLPRAHAARPVASPSAEVAMNVDPAPPSSASAGSTPAPMEEPKPSEPTTTAPSTAAAAAKDAPVAPSSTKAKLAADNSAGSSSAKISSVATACASGPSDACDAACAADAASCQKFAKALDTGVGASKNLKRAASMYQKACDAGSGAACNNLGVLAATGEGVPKDLVKAFGLYDQGCNQSDPTACVNQGSMEFSGNGVPVSKELATHHFLRGCDLGNTAGCVALSDAYGSGPLKDPAKSYEFARRACEANNKTGCAQEVLALVLGNGVPKDVQGGISQLDGMCTNQQQPAACEDLAKLYSGGLSRDVASDAIKQRDYTHKACLAGSTLYCGIEHVLAKGDSLQSKGLQNYALLKANCDKGDLVQCTLLGENLISGKGGIAVDKDKGNALLKDACAKGIARACTDLGQPGGQ